MPIIRLLTVPVATARRASSALLTACRLFVAFLTVLVLSAFSVFAAPGDLDTTFNPDIIGGLGTTAVQPDGKILIAGSSTSVGGIPRRGLARLHADGTLDETFAPFMSTENGLGFQVSLMVGQLDGKILVGGIFNSAAGVPRNNIARLEANGSLDLSFNPDAGGSVYTIAVQADGTVLVAGGFTGIGGTMRRYSARTRSPGSLCFSQVFTHVQSR